MQPVLGVDNLGMELLVPLRKRVEAVSNMIVRHVKVDRTRTPQEVLDVTGCRQHTDRKVVKNMPRGECKESDVIFFNVGRFISDNDLEEEFALRGLEAADPYSLAAINEEDPSFADDHPNNVHWKDADGRWCYAIFYRRRGERHVTVHRDPSEWGGDWWFAGLRK